jgi:hypothetical protein
MNDQMVPNEQALPFTRRELRTVKSRRYNAEKLGDDLTLTMRVESLAVLLDWVKRIDQELRRIGKDKTNVRLSALLSV